MHRITHAWDSTKYSCIKCGKLYRDFRENLKELDVAEIYEEDTREIVQALRCLT